MALAKMSQGLTSEIILAAAKLMPHGVDKKEVNSHFLLQMQLSKFESAALDLKQDLMSLMTAGKRGDMAIIVSEGLNSVAVTANIEDVLLTLKSM